MLTDLKKLIIVAAFLFFLFLSNNTFSYDQRALNLGLTSFNDGGPPAGPGYYLQDYLNYYTANRLNDNNGHNLPLPNTDLRFTANALQFIYISPKTMLNGHWGWNLIYAALLHAYVDDGLNNLLLRAQTGSGDLVFGPLFQFDPTMDNSKKLPRFVHRLELDIYAPVGKYSSRYTINPGSNFWSINPYWAFTYWFFPQLSIAVRLNYIWNAKNDDPIFSFGPLATSIQAGQAIYGNCALGYSLTDKFLLGLNGYFLRQINDTKINDDEVPGRRESVWAIGPGLLYNFTSKRENGIFFNTYFERDVRNRPQGTRLVLRFFQHF